MRLQTNKASPDSYSRLTGRVGYRVPDEFLYHPRNVAFAEKQEIQIGREWRFVRPAENDLGWDYVVPREFQADGRENVGDAHAMGDADDFRAIVALDLHQRFLIEVTWVAELSLDENDRSCVVETIVALQDRALLRQ